MASSVKFIQIKGTPTDYTLSEYQVKLAEAKSIPGAIIFGLYVKPGSPKVHYELWANNQQYSIGGGGDTKVQTGTCDPWDYATPGRPAGEEWPQDFDRGSFYIKINDVNQTKNGNSVVSSWTLTGVDQSSLTAGTDSDNIANKTAYVFVGESSSDLSTQANWHALSGNYNAENVYFPHGVLRTTSFGVKTKNGKDIVIDGVNKNLKDLLEYYLVEEYYPNLTAANNTSDGFMSSDTFNVSSAAPSISMKDSENISVSSGDYVKYGNDIIVTGSYNSTVTKTDSTDLTFTKSSIYGMTYGYYQGNAPGEGKRTSTATSISNGEVTVTVADETDADNAATTAYIEYNSTAYDTKEGTSGDTLSPSYTIELPGIGSHTVYIKTTNNGSWSRSFDWGENTLTVHDNKAGISTGNIPTTYYCSNKGNSKSDKTLSVTGKTLDIPGTPTIENNIVTDITNTKTVGGKQNSASFTVFYPVFSNIQNSSASSITELSGDSERITFTDTTSSITISATAKGMQFASANGKIKVHVPSGYYVSSASLGGSPMTMIKEDSTEEHTLGNNTKVDYNVYNSGDYAFSAYASSTEKGATCSITIKKESNN